MGDLPEGLSGGDSRWVRRACEQSLRRLGGEAIDLYPLHRPDPLVPIADTLAALNGLIDEGKVREIGCSNFSAAQLTEATRRPVSAACAASPACRTSTTCTPQAPGGGAC